MKNNDTDNSVLLFLFIYFVAFMLLVTVFIENVYAFTKRLTKKAWEKIRCTHPVALATYCSVAFLFTIAVIPKFVSGFDEPFYPNWMAYVLSIIVALTFVVTLLAIIFNKNKSYDNVFSSR